MNEKLLKYFAGLLTEQESVELMRELQDNPELKLEYEKISESLKELKSSAEPEISKNYYPQLLTELNRKRNYSFFYNSWLKYASSFAAALVLIAVYFWGFNNVRVNNEFLALNEYSSEIIQAYEQNPETFNNYITEDYYSYQEEKDYIEEKISGSYSAENAAAYMKVNSTESEDYFKFMNELTEDELEELYNKMVDIKIFKDQI